MFDVSDSRSEFRSNYDDSMADSIFPLPSMNSPMAELGCDLISPFYAPHFDSYADDSDGMIDDLLLPHYMKYDIEKQPQLLNLVSPNDILPVETVFIQSSFSSDPFIGTEYANKMFSRDQLDVCDDSDSFTVLPEVFDQMCEQFLSEKVFNDMNGSTDFDTMLEEDILPSITQSDCDNSIECEKDYAEREQIHSPGRIETSSYHPDNDHCYSKLSEDKDSKEVNINETDNVWTSAESPESSDSSSEEVDVVTVTEMTPLVPKKQTSNKNKQRKSPKSQKSKKNHNPPLSSKTFSAAMKRNIKRTTTVRRTYQRKINNSVETTPSNSLPSSAPSSRCSSDVEDAGKRANHNSSERKRREVLRSNLQHLRMTVPELYGQPKTPKVQILNSATVCVGKLELEEQKLCLYKKNLKAKRNALRTKLRNLQSEIKKLPVEGNRHFWQEMWLPSDNL